MPFSRFLGTVRMLVKARQDRIHEGFVLSAFTAFQMGASGGEMTFGQYLIGMGLSESKPDASPAKPEITAEESIAKAEAILAKAAKKGES